MVPVRVPSRHWASTAGRWPAWDHICACAGPVPLSGQDRGVSNDAELPAPTPVEAAADGAGSAPEDPGAVVPVVSDDSSPELPAVTDDSSPEPPVESGDGAGAEKPAEAGPVVSESAPEIESTPRGRPLPAGLDAATVVARMTEVVTDLEAIAATPDTLGDGKHPDDRALTERMRVLEETFRTLSLTGIAEPALRSRVQTARAIFANARAHRAESRAVERARAGEMKRALLVEAFALSQLAQGTSLSQLAGRRVGEEIAAPRRGAATAGIVSADASNAEALAGDVAADATPDAGAPDASAPDASAADAELSPAAEAAQDAAVEPVDATLADSTVADVEANVEASAGSGDTVGTATDEPASALPEPEPEPESPSAPPPVSTTAATVDISAIARRARELQNEWTNAGFAGREVENELQPLFRRYMQLVFDLSRKESNEKSDARRDLVAQARALAQQAGDEVASDAITRLVREAKALQNTWKAGEAAPPAVESGAWRQFSGALRQIFIARDRLAAGAREEREQIIAAVTALASAREPMRAMRDLGPLLRRWRESGPVSTPVYESLKVELDRAAATVRERADVERRKRDAEDAKSQTERAKNASKIIREAERSSSRGGRRQERPAAQAQAQGALAAALAEAFGRAERVAQEVRDLEKTVVDVRDKLGRAESGALVAATEEVQTTQGFTVQRQTIDPGAVNPERLRTELAQAEQALARRQAELAELTSNARGYGLSA